MPHSINYAEFAIVVILPAVFSFCFSRAAYKRLASNRFFDRSLRALRTFIISRALYVFLLGMMIAAFLIAIIRFGVSGEQARLMIATAKSASENTPTLILSGWSHFILPLVFLTIFLSIGSLAYMGRLVIRDVPAGTAPGKEYGGFRFTFSLLALSLILPPLIFGSLLLL